MASKLQAHRGKISLPLPSMRVEQLYPWPFADVAAALEKYKNADEIVWLQEGQTWVRWAPGQATSEAHGETHRIRRVSHLQSGSRPQFARRPQAGTAKAPRQAFAGID
ncbi:MAG: hypothetical protein R2710_05210 [Acidimicrobiales bacterium]